MKRMEWVRSLLLSIPIKIRKTDQKYLISAMKNKGTRLIVSSVFTIGWLILMRNMTRSLDPGVIIQFEFIGTAEKSTELLMKLREIGQFDLLTRSIFLDFIFALLYGVTFYYASAWVCNKLPLKHPLKRFHLLASLTIIAVVCDLVENVSLLKLIYYPPTDLFAYSAFLFARLSRY